jgi:rod shape-determining protein MreB
VLNFIESVLDRFSTGLAIDLGSANTLIHVQNKGVLLREPSVVAVAADNPFKVMEVGDEARQMIGRTPGAVIALRPIKRSVIADFDQTEQMLRHFLTKLRQKHRIVRPIVVLSAPLKINEVERLAAIEAIQKIGACQVFVLSKSMAAALGAGLPVTEPVGSMVIDIGAGSSEASVISFKGVVASGAVRVGGDDMDEAIVEFVKRKYKMAIGIRTAEDLKIAMASVMPLREESSKEVRGRDLASGLPRRLVISSEEIREAITGPLGEIVEMLRDTLDSTPPEIAADILSRGVVLSGGGALIRGMDILMSRITGMPVKAVEDPFSCAARGSAKFLTMYRNDPSIRKLAMDEARFGFI